MVGRSQPTFTAIDFETSAVRSDSACAVGLALVRNGSVTERFSTLIRPPNRRIRYTKIHGLTWDTLKASPPFPEAAYAEIMGFACRSEFFVAHNAAFDWNILRGCCKQYGLEAPNVPWHCTMISSATLSAGRAASDWGRSVKDWGFPCHDTTTHSATPKRAPPWP